MNEAPKPGWKRWTFSLRSFLLAVAAIGLALGYEISWVHQRRDFLAEQQARQEAAWPNQEDNPFMAKTIRWWQNIQLTDRPAPGFLWVFGDQAVDRLLLAIPDRDITFRNQTYEMPSSQVDFQRAKRLFPEADIIPMRWDTDIPRESERMFFQVRVIDRPHQQ